MIMELENQLSKLHELKNNLKEMGASLWLSIFREEKCRIRA